MWLKPSCYLVIMLQIWVLLLRSTESWKKKFSEGTGWTKLRKINKKPFSPAEARKLQPPNTMTPHTTKQCLQEEHPLYDTCINNTSINTHLSCAFSVSFYCQCIYVHKLVEVRSYRWATRLIPNISNMGHLYVTESLKVNICMCPNGTMQFLWTYCTCETKFTNKKELELEVWAKTIIEICYMLLNHGTTAQTAFRCSQCMCGLKLWLQNQFIVTAAGVLIIYA